MQSGFFLQLILTLAALASRLDVLVQDQADALRGSWASMYRLFCARNPSEAKKIQKPQAAVALDSDTQELPAHASPSTLPVVEEMMGGVEDTGETIKRVEVKVPIEPSIVGSANSAPPFDPAKTKRPDEAKPAPTIVDDDEDTITVADITATHAPAQIITVPPTAPPTKIATTTVHLPKQPKKRPVEDAKAKEQAPKRKKKKKDAIDDIFGF